LSVAERAGDSSVSHSAGPTAVEEPARRVPVVRRAQVVVLGGGPSGIAAAVAAARSGASTLLVERYGFLGGMGTAAGVTSFCGLHANVNGEIRQVVHGIADELLDRLRALDGLNDTHAVLGRIAAQAYDNAAYKCAADDLVLGAGVDLLFHALAVGMLEAEPGRIAALLVETKSGRGAVVGDVFVDCSGDADLAAWAGAPFEKGGDDGYLAYPTLMFRLGHVDTPRALRDGKPNIRRLLAEAAEKDGTTFPRRAAYINPQKHAGEWRANVTQLSHGARAVDATNADELSRAEIDGRRQVRLYYDFLKRYVPGFEAAYLLEIAPQIGVRETRRIVGRYQLSGRDVLAARDFPDTIGVDGWPVERHVRGDVEWSFIEGRGYCQIPFSALVPQRVENLLVAGRCASATQDGQASLRVSGPCFAMGQAAGTAAAMATSAAVSGRPLVVGDVDVAALQERLRAAGAFLGIDA
jgi:hypothetical protein